MIDSESDISCKVDPLKVAFCQVCVEGIGGGGGCFRMDEVYEETDASITNRLSCCIPYTRKYLVTELSLRCLCHGTRGARDTESENAIKLHVCLYSCAQALARSL